MEETYYKDQIDNRLRESMFQAQVLAEGRGRIESFQESSIEPNNGWPNERAQSGMLYEDQSLVNALSPQTPLRPLRDSRLIDSSPVSQGIRVRAQRSGARRRVGAEQRQGRRLRRTDRMLRDRPEVEYNSDLDPDAQMAGGTQSEFSAQEESYGSEASEAGSSPEQRRLFEVRRTNMHEAARRRAEEAEAETEQGR